MTDAEFIKELERRGIGPGRLHAVEDSDNLTNLGTMWDMVRLEQTVAGGTAGTFYSGWYCECGNAGEGSYVHVGPFGTAGDALAAALEQS